jgi:hypothetical protein
MWLRLHLFGCTPSCGRTRSAETIRTTREDVELVYMGSDDPELTNGLQAAKRKLWSAGMQVARARTAAMRQPRQPRQHRNRFEQALRVLEASYHQTLAELVARKDAHTQELATNTGIMCMLAYGADCELKTKFSDAARDRQLAEDSTATQGMSLSELEDAKYVINFKFHAIVSQLLAEWKLQKAASAARARSFV